MQGPTDKPLQTVVKGHALRYKELPVDYKTLGLDPDQEKAATYPGSALVVAGPGAGKTRVLLARVLWLLDQGVPPEKIFLLTFTLRTRAELRNRIKTLGSPDPRIETFHALAYSLLAEASDQPPRLLSEEESLAFFKRLLKKDKSRLSPKRLLEFRGRERPEYQAFFQEYERYLEATHSYDYYRLLAVFKGKRGTFKDYHLLIDEYQDLSPEIIEFLKFFKGATFFLVGDPAQAIYGFRRADPQKLKPHLQTLSPDLKILFLSKSYRVPSRILEIAERWREDPFEIRHNLAASVEGGWVEGYAFSSEQSEAVGLAKEVSRLVGGTTLEKGQVRSYAPGDLLVLARLRQLLKPLKEAFLKEGLPLAEPEEEAQSRLQEIQKRLEGGLSRPRLTEDLQKIWPEASQFLDLEEEKEILLARLKLLRAPDLLKVSREGVNLLTIHGAKGLEAPVVILAGAEEGLLPFNLLPDSDLSEEKRLLYVALTRAKEGVVWSWAKRRFLFGRPLPGRVSRWLASLPFREPKRPRPKPAQQGLF